MNRFIASLVGCFFFCMATVFASTDSVNTPNWTDLLLKSVNFFIFFGLLWFFFRKKIVAALRGIAQGEYKLFFSALNKKKQLEEELKSIYQKLNQKKEEIRKEKKVIRMKWKKKKNYGIGNGKSKEKKKQTSNKTIHTTFIFNSSTISSDKLSIFSSILLKFF